MVNPNFTPDERDLDILAALRAAKGVVSGQVLGQRLGISRVALWKRIERLKRYAYRIEGGRRGYRLLDEDAVGAWAFQDGDPVIYRNETASTMDEAWGLAERGAVSGTLVIADCQSAGRGRQGSVWPSPGGGLYLTLILRPRLPASHAACLALEGACAMSEWLEMVHGCRLQCQWPNGLMAAGRKVGGLLVELAGAPETPRFYLLGLGLDLRAMGLAGQDGSAPRGANGRPPLRRELAAAFRDHMAAWAQAPRLRPRDWEHRCAQLSRPVLLEDWRGRPVAGIVRGFDARGGLVLADSTGAETAFRPEEILKLHPADTSPQHGEPA